MKALSASAQTCIGAGTFVVLALAGALLLRQPAAASLRPAVAAAVVPAGDEWYLGYAGRGIDYDVLYHGLNGSLQAAREAELLILGNSRTLYGIDQAELQAFEKRTGVRTYCLAFAYNERYEFPLTLIEKQDLRPRWVLVNADPFFRPGLSEVARHTLVDDAFGAWQTRFEATTTFYVTRLMHRWVPRISLTDRGLGAYFRSRQDGTIFRSAQRTTRLGDAARHVVRLEPGDLETTRDVQLRLAKRETTLLMTNVPPVSGDYARELELKARLPLLLPQVEGMQTFDGSHLDADSARRFSAALFQQLEEFVQPGAASR